MKRDLHQSRNPTVEADQALLGSPDPIVDVRSPKEFAQGAVPGAINVPLLDDEERHMVGLLYKQVGQKAAVDKGYEIFGPKLAEYQKIFGELEGKRLIVYCARGGMRSGVITAMLRNFGFEAHQVKGGYKAFRNWTLDFLESVEIPRLVVLQGRTGVGKTLVLNRLPNALDLEGLAQHRGSMFGGIGKEPRTQKEFEGLLAARILGLDLSHPVFIEGESRKVGRVSLPAHLYQQMQEAKTLLLTASLHTRTERTIDEYVLSNPEELASLRYFISTLKESLGKAKVAELLDQFDQGRYEDCFSQILTLYYDVKYDHSLKRIPFVGEVDTEDLDEAARKIQALFPQGD